MRTPTKHSTNVDTAVPVVPVPVVGNRPPIVTSSTESNAIPKTSVRFLLNSNSDTSMPVQQQFTFISNTRVQLNDQTADRPIIINSAGTSTKKSDSDAKSITGESSTTHFSPIIINQPKSSQIMPLVQNSDMKTFNRIGPNLSTIIPNVNSNARVVSIDTSNHPSPNLLTTLRPGNRDTLSSHPTVQVCSSVNQTTTESVSAMNSSGGESFLKASSLVSHSTVPSTESNQTTSLISVVPVDPSRSNLQSSTTTIRPSQRVPIAVAPNRPNATGILINRPTTISRNHIIAPVSPLNSSSLNPIRKRARKQQLLAPQGIETSNSSARVGQTVSFVEMSNSSSTLDKSKVPGASSVSSTPNMEAALHATNSLPSASSGSVTDASTPVMNVRLLPLRSSACSKEGPCGSHFEQVPYATTSGNSSQFHSLVVSSSSVISGNEDSNAASQSTTTVPSVSPATSLVTASSFPSSPSTGQTSMYVFPSSAAMQMHSLRPNNATATTTNPSSNSNVLQVRFRPPTAVARPPLTTTFIQQQTVRTVLSPSVTNNPATGFLQTSPAAVGKKGDWKTSAGIKSTVEEISRNESAKPAIPVDASIQPTVPIVRIPDPNSRNSSLGPQQTQPPLKRPRKQSNSASGIKKQCTWELLTDPLDSSKSVWRSPHRLQQEPPSSQQQSSSRPAAATFADPESGMKVEAIDSDSVIHGLPRRMHLYKSKTDPDQSKKRGQVSSGSTGPGSYKGSKANHFLRFDERKFCTFPSRTSSASMGAASSNTRRRELRDATGSASDQFVRDNEDVRTVLNILDSRSLQDYFKYVNNPLDASSTLDLTCWRLDLCLRNCDGMMVNETSKYEKLTSALDGAFYRNRIESVVCPDVPRLLCSSLTDQVHQNLLTEIFLQAIPPASPALLPKKFLNSFDEEEKIPLVDIIAIKERTRALIQRVKTLVDGMQKLKDLSNELLTDHADFVQSFVEQIEYLRRNNSNPPPSSPSPNNNSPNADDQDFDSDDSILSPVGDDLLNTTHLQSSKHLRLPSASQKGVSSDRAPTFQNERRR